MAYKDPAKRRAYERALRASPRGDKIRKYQREYQKAHRIQYRDAQRRYYLAHPEEWKAYSAKNREKNGKRIAARTKCLSSYIKAQAMALYGGRCANPKCPQHYHPELAVLSIDHIYGGGRKERLSSGQGGRNWYTHLLRIPKRADLRCLCISCNFRARILGSNPLAWDTSPTVEQVLKEHEDAKRRKAQGCWKISQCHIGRAGIIASTPTPPYARHFYRQRLYRKGQGQ